MGNTATVRTGLGHTADFNHRAKAGHPSFPPSFPPSLPGSTFLPLIFLKDLLRRVFFSLSPRALLRGSSNSLS